MSAIKKYVWLTTFYDISTLAGTGLGIMLKSKILQRPCVSYTGGLQPDTAKRLANLDIKTVVCSSRPELFMQGWSVGPRKTAGIS